jgi:hypothetical protein
MVLKIVTITGPDTLGKDDAMGIVFTGHVDSERLKVKALSFLGITFSFFDFPDHSGVHVYFFSFQDIDIFCNKKARKDSVLSFYGLVNALNTRIG